MKYCSRTEFMNGQEREIVLKAYEKDATKADFEASKNLRISRESIDKMTEAFIYNWNSVVNRGDTVYHLGDFAFAKNVSAVEWILSRLNGQVHHIFGNHDGDPVRNAEGFAWKGDYKEVKVNGQQIMLFHYPIADWNKKHRKSWHFYGHTHFNRMENPNERSLEVGIDRKGYGYTPLSFEQVSELIAKKDVKQVNFKVKWPKDPEVTES